MRIIRKEAGFTLIELMVALIVLGILATLAFSIYRNYVDKAKVTIAEHAVIEARQNLDLYNMDNGKFPDSIDFSTCHDENSRAVFSTTFCNQIKNDLLSIEYTAENNNYVLKARAKDVKNTLITTNSIKMIK